MKDPEILLKANSEWRQDWDKIEEYEPLLQYCRPNCLVTRTLNRSNKQVMGIDQKPKEFIDKRIFFKASHALPNCPPKEDDIYLWHTHVPNNLYELNKKFSRCSVVIGFTKIGK